MRGRNRDLKGWPLFSCCLVVSDAGSEILVGGGTPIADLVNAVAGFFRILLAPQSLQQGFENTGSTVGRVYEEAFRVLVLHASLPRFCRLYKLFKHCLGTMEKTV
jgi:hypothetical protein